MESGVEWSANVNMNEYVRRVRCALANAEKIPLENLHVTFYCHQ